MAKKLVKMIGCRYVCYHICQTNNSFSLRQNISNLYQSIFVVLTVYYDKIFNNIFIRNLLSETPKFSS